MATPRSKRNLADLNIEISQEHSRNNLAQNSNLPRSQKDYITQVNEQNEGRTTKKLSQEFSGIESRILDALSWLNDFLHTPILQGHSGITPVASRITLGTNQRTNEDDSQCDLYPEPTISQSQNTQNTEQGDEFGLVTGVPDEITYCSPRTSSGKQKKPHSANQLQVCSQNNPVTVEADQFLLAFRELAKTITRRTSIATFTESTNSYNH